MEIKVLLFLFVLSTGWCCNARNLFSAELEINQVQVEREIEEFGRNKQLCTLCEDFSTLAIGYLAQNKTQSEIISILHKSCSKLLNLEQQCITLVDYYAPLFFSEVSTVQPAEFCGKIGFCEKVSISQHISQGGCEFCQHIVTEALQKLKDPDTELDIVELLLKMCDAVESDSKKCKRLVFEYAPLILCNAERYLEKNDVCAIVHACTSATTATERLSGSESSMHSAY